MGLFFSVMHCDEHTMNEIYVRRNETCVPVPKSKSDKVGTFYNDVASCEAQTDPQSSPVMISVEPEETHPHEEHFADEPAVEVGAGKVNVVWRDCGSAAKLTNITKVTPDTMGIGLYNNIATSAVLPHDIEHATFSLKMSSGGFGLTLMELSGDACDGKIGKWTLEEQIHLSWLPMTCPLKAGDFTQKMRLFVDPAVPVSIAHTTTTVLLHDDDGAEISCVEVVTEGAKADASDVMV